MSATETKLIAHKSKIALTTLEHAYYEARVALRKALEAEDKEATIASCKAVETAWEAFVDAYEAETGRIPMDANRAT